MRQCGLPFYLDQFTGGRPLQIHAERLGRVELARLMDEDLREVGVDPPIPLLVGDGQGVPAHPCAEACVIELVLQGTQAGLDVTQAIAIGELAESHAEELVPAAEPTHPRVAAIPLHTPTEVVVGCVLHQLSEDRSAIVHPPLQGKGRRDDGGSTVHVQIVCAPIRS